MREHPALRSLRLVSRTGGENRFLTPQHGGSHMALRPWAGPRPSLGFRVPCDLSPSRPHLPPRPCRVQNLYGGGGGR